MTKKKLSVKLLTLLMLLSMLMQVIPAYAYAQEDEGKIQKLSDFKTDKEILEAKLNEDQSTEEKTVIDISSKNDIKEFIVVYQKTLALNEKSLKSAEIEVDKEYRDSGVYGVNYTSARLKLKDAKESAPENSNKVLVENSNSSDSKDAKLNKISITFDVKAKPKKGELFATVLGEYVSVLEVAKKDESTNKKAAKAEKINNVAEDVLKEPENQPRTRRTRALAITYAKFKFIANTGEPISGNIGYKLVEVDGSRETVFKQGTLNTSNKEVEFTGMKLGPRYKLYITEVPREVYDRLLTPIAEFYFDAAGIHYVQGGGVVFITKHTLRGINFFPEDSSGRAVNRNEVKFALKRVVPGGEVEINITQKPHEYLTNAIEIGMNNRDVHLGDTYRLYITQAPNGFVKPNKPVSEFKFSYEDGKLFMRFDKGGTVTTLLRNGEAERPLNENEYYGFIGVNGKLRVSKDVDNSKGAEAFCFSERDTFPNFGDRAVYTKLESNADVLYSKAKNPRVGKKELYDAVRKVYFYCETHKEELLRDYGLDNQTFWMNTQGNDQDHGYYAALQQAFWYYSDTLNYMKQYQGTPVEGVLRNAVDHIISESAKVSEKDMESVKVNIYNPPRSPYSRPYQVLISLELKRRTEINIIKLDETNSYLNGAVFKLEKLNDAAFTPVTIGRGKNISQFKFTDLEAGEYRLTEVEAPKNHVGLTAPIDFKIEDKAGKFTVTMTSSNPLVTLDGSSLTFTVKNKRPKTNIKVTKKWFDDNGQEVQVQNGSITYDLMQVAITDNGRTSEKTYLAGERLTKADNWTRSYNDLPLTGKNQNGEEVTFSYYVVENPVSDYKISYSNNNGTESKTASGVAVSKGTLIIKNTKIARYTLPETGGTGTNALYFAGMAMIAISISTLMIRRAKKSK